MYEGVSEVVFVLDGKLLKVCVLFDVICVGIVMVLEDCKCYGIVLLMSVGYNIIFVVF